MKKFICILLFAINNLAEANKLKVVVTNRPIASLVAMISGDQANIDILAPPCGCPHNYHMKPSQHALIKNSDILVYINQDFDAFIQPHLGKYKGRVLNIGDLPGLQLLKNNTVTNWHIWFSIDNALIILEEVKKILVGLDPKNTNLYNSRAVMFSKQIKKFQARKKYFEQCNILLLTDNIEYLFGATKFNIYKNIAYNDNITLNFAQQIENIVKTKNLDVVIISDEQNYQFFKKLVPNKIVQIYGENWYDVQNFPLEEQYFIKTQKILDEINHHCDQKFVK